MLVGVGPRGTARLIGERHLMQSIATRERLGGRNRAQDVRVLRSGRRRHDRLGGVPRSVKARKTWQNGSA
ncbi:hypothetical protein CHLRE_16g658926v5 [Chlamydomonas reinhardtii]|uniref:Uncharacterized protein n=1 Tax=Chlamydomonas reinhardtii TaxID=3055 RepID=A0A2K3CTD7_CHLRE|nr:uncharacterized protein CHLRE_16g658926v5 [Chlamydomonas reinhardtii]PNW71550.1 hypothetical protein CHLRE_16g658926v5 [Chlamydomonas reinhardtii]